MLPLDTKQLEQALAANNTDQAKQILDSYFTQELSPAEKGEAYTTVAELYLRINKTINQRYSEELDSAITKLQQLGSAERKLDDTSNLLDARKTIQNS